MQFYWFRSVVKLYNSMPKSNSDTLSCVLKADLSLQSSQSKPSVRMLPSIRVLPSFRMLKADLSKQSRDTSLLLDCSSKLDAQGCGVVIHLCKQFSRVLVSRFKRMPF